ncbi:MAG: acyl--CoA ligase [Burkholderiaceae bacterium]|nr:acyl--CoA ligase [Burkholderiaceae bacterium]
MAGKPALVLDSTRLSYGDLARRVDGAALALRAAGVTPGARVVLVGENTAEVVVLLLAAMRAGAWAVPLNARMSAGEIDAILAHAQPRMVCYASDSSPEAQAHARRAGARPAPPLAGLQGLCGVHLAAFDGAGTEAEPVDDVALMLYTSGSTGTPKGVMLTHANLGFVTAASLRQQVLREDDFIFHALPLSHSFGLVSALLCGLRAGATLQLVTRFSAERLARAIVDDGITVFQGVPAMYARLQEWALQGRRSLQPNRLRLAYIGGSQVDAGRKAQAEALLGLPLHQGYGLTEAAPAATRTVGHAPPAGVSAGWPIPGIEVELRDAHGGKAPPGTRGEVWVRGPNVMKGYFRDAATTRAAVDAQGWLHTGDVGEFGPAGDLAIVGRIKEMIIRGGFNVYPAEIERAIAAYPGVAQCAVVGRAVPGDEEVVAFVEPLAGQRVDGEALRRFLRDRLAPYKIPAEVVCMTALPATGTGKLAKARIKAMAAERTR